MYFVIRLIDLIADIALSSMTLKSLNIGQFNYRADFRAKEGL